jgi:L-alanine-DL-glutamate epimerase-like enolase superfamily enzyme
LSLRQRTARPIIFDELGDSDAAVAQIIANDAADGLGLKISKSGGLTKGRRQRDMSIAAVVHLGQTIPRRFLRCVLDTRDMVAQEIAAFDCTLEDGGVYATSAPGLGVTPNMAVLGEPVATYEHL